MGWNYVPGLVGLVHKVWCTNKSAFSTGVGIITLHGNVLHAPDVENRGQGQQIHMQGVVLPNILFPCSHQFHNVKPPSGSGGKPKPICSKSQLKPTLLSCLLLLHLAVMVNFCSLSLGIAPWFNNNWNVLWTLIIIIIKWSNQLNNPTTWYRNLSLGLIS